MKMKKIKIAHIVCVAINIPVTVLTAVASCYPSSFGLLNLASPHVERTIRAALCVGSMLSSFMALTSLIYLNYQYVEVVDSDLPTQCSEIIDKPPSYSDAVEMDQLPSYSEVIKVDNPNFGVEHVKCCTQS